MSVGQRMSGRAVALVLALAGLIALLVPQVMAMMTPDVPRALPQAWSQCETPDRCRPVDPRRLRLAAPTTTLTTVIPITSGRGAAPPLALHIAAMASAEVWLNGARVGTNGVVGDTRARERPGRFSALIPLPEAHLRPGPNRVTVRLSSHALWAPVAKPIHDLTIAPYRDPLHGTLRHYLPTLLLISFLALAFLGAAGAQFLRGRSREPALTVLVGAALAQAVIEASKLALTFPYPWQLARLSAVAALAALGAIALHGLTLKLVPDPARRRILTFALLAALAIALLGPPWWDAKALWAIRAGYGAVLAAATLGALAGMHKAWRLQAAAVVALALSWAPGFLDVGYYIVTLLVFGVVAADVARSRPAVPASSADPKHGSPGDLLTFPNGASRHVIRADALLYVRAADDYCRLFLIDGRELLSTSNLSAAVGVTPGLVRIHRSHAVSLRFVTAVHRSSQGASVELHGGVRLAVGRRYRSALKD